jgi:lipoyl(octanoyl) transferase
LSLEDFQEHRPKSSGLLYDLGFSADYKAVWDFQKILVEKRIADEINDSLIIVEHDHVLTTGRGYKSENILVEDLPKFEIERGGDVTYHGPGQLIVYPIISLTPRGLGVRQYVELLEGTIMDVLNEYDLKSSGKLGPLTGVWVDDERKIASIGVACSHWVTYHGLALNVSTDLSYFQRIKPCGFESSIMTSISRELGRRLEIDEVKKKILMSFSKRLDLDFVPCEIPPITI